MINEINSQKKALFNIFDRMSYFREKNKEIRIRRLQMNKIVLFELKSEKLNSKANVESNHFVS